MATDSQLGTVTGLSYDGNSGSLTAPSYDRRLFSTTTYAEVLDYAGKFESTNGSASATPIIDDVTSSGSPVVYAFRKSNRKLTRRSSPRRHRRRSALSSGGKFLTWRTGKLQFSLSLETDMFDGAIDLLEQTRSPKARDCRGRICGRGNRRGSACKRSEHRQHGQQWYRDSARLHPTRRRASENLSGRMQSF